QQSARVLAGREGGPRVAGFVLAVDRVGVLNAVLILLICGGIALLVRWDRARQRRQLEEADLYEDEEGDGLSPESEIGYDPEPPLGTQSATHGREKGSMTHLYAKGMSG